MAAPAPLAVVIPDRPGVEDILGEVGIDLRLDDNHSGVVTSNEEARLTRLYSWATAEVRDRYLSRYDPTALSNNWCVYYWCCLFVAHRLSKRKGNAASSSLEAWYQETVEILQLLEKGTSVLSNVAQRGSPSLSLTNLRLDPRKHTKQVVVETSTSDTTPAKHQQNKDWVSALVPEPLP